MVQYHRGINDHKWAWNSYVSLLRVVQQDNSQVKEITYSKLYSTGFGFRAQVQFLSSGYSI